MVRTNHLSFGLIHARLGKNEGSSTMSATRGLDEQQRRRLWGSMIGAHVRADYFARLASWYGGVAQACRFVSGMSCFVAALLVFREHLGVLAGLFAIGAGMVTMLELLFTLGNKRAGAVGLHWSWHRLGIDYEALWIDTYRSDAGQALVKLEERGADLSNRALSTPYNERRMTRRMARSAARVHPRFATGSQTTSSANQRQVPAKDHFPPVPPPKPRR